ncbi:MAG: DUF423 domain-containing protein [Pseudomonadota bacterium]
MSSRERAASSSRTVLLAGAINAALSVIAGAFGAHGLQGRVSDRLLSAFETGAQYHFYHALGLILIALAMVQFSGSRWFSRAAVMMQVGIVLFSGSLYALALTGITKLGAVTPFGGLSLIVAWGMVAFAVTQAGQHYK